MQNPTLGYAQKYVGLPRLRPRHNPRGTNTTPPALAGAVCHTDQNGSTRIYRVGFRVLRDHPRGNLELVHVEGAVFPPGQPNVFQDLRAGVSAFLHATGQE